MNSIYLEKIKNISKISISDICKELKINRSNLLNGKSTKENEQKDYDKLMEKIKKEKIWYNEIKRWNYDKEI